MIVKMKKLGRKFRILDVRNNRPYIDSRTGQTVDGGGNSNSNVIVLQVKRLNAAAEEKQGRMRDS